MTIVQVLLHDPLSEWTLSPHRAYALQGRRRGNDGDTADPNVSIASSGVEQVLDEAGMIIMGSFQLQIKIPCLLSWKSGLLYTYHGHMK